MVIRSQGEAYNHVHLPVDRPQQRRDEQRKKTVPDPVGRGSERDSLGADLGGIDFGRVGPRSRTDGCGERADEEVRHGDDGFTNVGIRHDPRDGAECGVCMRVGYAVSSLEAA
jgi:hypothetical protein